MEHFYHCKSPWINQHCERTPRPGPRQGWVCVSVWALRLKGSYLHIFFMLWSRSTPLPPIPVPQRRDRYPPVPPSSPLIDHLLRLSFLARLPSKWNLCFVLFFFVCLSFDKWMITWALGIDAIGRGRLSRQSVTASFHCHIVAKRLQRAQADCFKNQFIPHYLLKIKVHIHPNYRFYPETLSSLALFCSVAAYWTAQPPCRPQTEGIFFKNHYIVKFHLVFWGVFLGTKPIS